MDAAQLFNALQQSTLASSFFDESMFRGADGASCKTFSPGTVLFREGEPSDSFYVVHSGHVALDMTVPTRGPIRLLTVGPGEIVAWSALVSDGRMTTSATAVDEVRAVEFSGTALLRRCEMQPELGYRLMRRLAAALAKRLLATRLQMLDLFSADAHVDNGGVL